MNVTLIGSFIFINQGYGVLSSLYHNIGLTEPYPETAKKIRSLSSAKSQTDLFEGLYKTVWLEPGTDDKTDLEIRKQTNGTYKLKWFVRSKIYYEGIGFLRNQELIGSYWQLK